jgi:tRNA/tmRNA/rRNA uracil-C5-methylase (TrmA/RlmC/RlmD family)
MPYRIELDAKKGILLEDLRRIGGIAFEEPIDVHPSPSEYEYRNHVQVKIDAHGKLGFFRKKSHDIVHLPSEGCLLLQPSINRHLLELRGLMQPQLPRHLPARNGSIRIRANDEGLTFCKGDPRRDDDVYAVYTVGDLQFRIGIDDFFQVNRYLNKTWVDLIVRFLDPDPRDGVFDLFCGSGLIALTLAPFAREIIGIEANGSAVRNADYNASLNGIDNARFVLGDLTTHTDIWRWKSSTMGRAKVVVDPPRTGLDRKLIASIAQLDAALIVYASCNSATFARDAMAWGAYGYRPRAISMVDMFPRTRHIETVAQFVK